MSKYFLKNKDTILIEFEKIEKTLENEFGKYTFQDVNILKIYNQFNDIKDNKTLKEWIEKRKVPKNREFVDKIIATYSSEKNDILDFVNVCLALSLNDSYWIVPKDKNYKWQKYNLYVNKFDETLPLVALTGYSHKVSGLTISPEYTTNGMLKKCWHREKDGNIYLYKGSSKEYANYGKEAFSEFYMYKIAQTLGFDAIKYDLKKIHNELVSSCELFTSEDFGFKPIYYCIDENKRNLKGVEFENEILKVFDSDKYADMMLFDALIYNTDRHYGNFGVIIENDTSKILKPAPLFDNGNSLINYLTQDDLENIKEAMKSKKSFQGYNFDTQAKRYAQPRHIKQLQKLQNFKFTRHKKYNLDEKWLTAIEQHISKRANEIIDFIHQKRQKND